MEDLREKFERIENQLNELLGHVRKSPTREQRKGGRLVRTKGQGLLEQILKRLDEISAELGTVKKTLSTRTSTESGRSRIDPLATNSRAMIEAEHNAQQQGQTSPAISESRQPVSPVTASIEDAPVQLGQTSPDVSSRQPVSPATEGHPSAITPPDQSETVPMFHCKYEDIGPKLNEEKFEEFSSDPIVKERGYFKLLVDDLPPLTVEEASISQPGEDHHTSFSSCRDPRGFVKLSKRQNRDSLNLSFPLPEPQKTSWSQGELKEFWEKTLKDPPQDMSYIIGNPLFPDIELGPGQGLEKRGGRDIPGVGTTYAYHGHGVSGSIMHGEDARLCSINLLRSGAPKLWLNVWPAFRKRLEDRMRQEFPKMRKCSQCLRHLSVFIPPSKLDEWEIPYSLDYCNPGEAMVTMGGVLHSALNRGTNYALSSNIMLDSDEIPKDYEFCSQKCDPHPITAAHLEIREQCLVAEIQANEATHPTQQEPRSQTAGTKRKAAPENQLKTPLAEVQANKVTRPIQQEPQSQTTGTKRKAAPENQLSDSIARMKRKKISPTITTLSEAVCGKEAFYRLCGLIQSWRNQSKPLFDNGEHSAVQLVQFIDIAEGPFDNRKNSAVQLVQIIDIAEGRSQLYEILVRIAKLKLAEIIDERKAGRLKADQRALTGLIKDLQWEHTKKNHGRLKYLLSQGRQWKKICGSFNGLLWLIPPNREDGDTIIPGSKYYSLSLDDIQSFHSLLDTDEFMKSLCQIGDILQASIFSNAEVPEFKWESEDPQRISRLSIKALAPLVEKFPTITENVYDTSYDWPKPDNWPWEWPKHPGWIPPSEPQCSLCTKSKCNCIDSCLPKRQPRITTIPGKGQGVVAIGTTYTKGQILAELVGEFYPLDTFKDGYAIEFTRPDLNDEPVAQIHTKEKGNWVRKVNHSDEPSAEWIVMKISGWMREMLVAIHDIPHNCEITAFCGSGFLRLR